MVDDILVRALLDEGLPPLSEPEPEIDAPDLPPGGVAIDASTSMCGRASSCR